MQELTQKKSEAEKELKKLQDQEPEFQELEKKIIRYEQCVFRFKHLLDSLNENLRKKKEREKQIQIESKKLKAEEVEIERLAKLIEEIKPVYDNREELKKKAEELIRLLQLKKLEETIEKEEARLNKGAKVLHDTVQQIEKLKTGAVKIRDTSSLISFSCCKYFSISFSISPS